MHRLYTEVNKYDLSDVLESIFSLFSHRLRNTSWAISLAVSLSGTYFLAKCAREGKSVLNSFSKADLSRETGIFFSSLNQNRCFAFNL